MKFLITFATLILVLVSCQTSKLETQITNQKPQLSDTKFPNQIGFVNDFEKIFSEVDIVFLENLLIDYKNNFNKQIVVITIDSIPKKLEFDQYAIQISEVWKVGKDNDDNGLTVLLSKSLRKVRISTTEKTRFYLGDDFCKKVIDENMIPEFKKGKYYDGVLLGLDKLIRKWI